MSCCCVLLYITVLITGVEVGVVVFMVEGVLVVVMVVNG